MDVIKQEAISSTAEGKSVVDVHHKKDYYIIPQNKLGQDVFIRASEIRRPSDVIKMPSGDSKTLKVPVSKNMLDSHMKGSLLEKLKTMVAIIIADAEVCSFELLIFIILSVVKLLFFSLRYRGDLLFTTLIVCLL